MSAAENRQSFRQRFQKIAKTRWLCGSRKRLRTRISHFERLELRQMMAIAVWTNVLQPLDVSDSPDSVVSPLDALLVINELNLNIYAPFRGNLPTEVDDSLKTTFVDVNCSGNVTPIDALLVINQLNAQVKGESSSSTLPTWAFNTVGGSRSKGNYTASACSPKLNEGDSYSSQLSTTVTLPSSTSSIKVQFSAPLFDIASKNSIRDAFEIVLLDESGQPITLPFGANRDASYNWSEGFEPAFSPGSHATTLPPASVSSAEFNLSGVPAGTKVQVVARLLNNDADSGSSVVIRRVEVLGATETAPTGMPAVSSTQAATDPIDANLLTDVSQSVTYDYGRTTLFDDNQTLVTDLQATNVGTSALAGRILVVVDNLSEPSIAVINPDGYLPGGRAYFVMNNTDASGWLRSGSSTEKRELRFRNFKRNHFTYSLTTLAELNQAPNGFTSIPLREIEAGRTYSTTAQATDPDGQTLNYTLLAAPIGMKIDSASGNILWDTTLADVGSQSVMVQAADPYGLSVTQSFTISVLANVQNRPPVFTSLPATEAKVAGAFEVNTIKVGDKPVGIAGGRFDGKNFAVATVNASDANLSVGKNSVSVGEPKPSGKLFQSGQDVDIGLPKFNHQSDVNSLESFAQGDFNNDGNSDFIATGIYSQYDFRSTLSKRRLLTITLGDGQGGFSTPSNMEFAVPTSDADHIYYLNTGDFNGDGKLDLIGEYLNDNSTSGANAPRLFVLPGNGDGTFGSAIITDLAGLRSEQFEIVDINGDSKLDIVAINSNAQRAGTFFGNGDGTFGVYREFANFLGTGTGMYYGAAVGDLDGVNGPDVVLPDWQLQKLYIYLNDGQGGYSRQGTLDARQPFWPYSGIGLTLPQTTWIGDFDGDGKADILYSASNTGNSNYGGLGLYKGGGDGISFTYKDAAQGFQQRPYNAHKKPVDFNGDGKLDIVLGGTSVTSNFTMGVGLNRGDGTFDTQVYGLPYAQRESASSANYSSSFVLTGDYNRDGLLDASIVSSPSRIGQSRDSSGVTILFAETPGVLAAPRALSLPSEVSATVTTITGDVNNDGNLDLLIGAGDRFSTRLGTGDGTFGPVFPATQSFYANDPHYATLVDLDHDGLLDLLWSRIQLYQGASQAYMAALGNGDGTFRVTFNLSVPDVFYGAKLIPTADFNGDGYVDFVAYFGSAFAVGTGIDVYLYNPSVPGTFTASYRYIYPGDSNGFNGSAINNTLTRGDFDGDGIIDLLAVGKKIGNYSNRINFFKGKGNGTFEEPTSADIFLTNTDSLLVEPSWTDSGDVNNDGKLDFVLASAYSSQAVFLGNGDGTFQTPIQYSEGFTFGADRTVVLQDIDGDGNLDLSFRSERGRSGISIRRGLGDGYFSPAENYFLTGDFGPGEAIYSDIDNDGVKDLVIADNSRPSYTSIFPGSNPGLVAITTADVNNDGQLDTLVVNQVNGHIKLLLGQGDGSLVRQPDLLVGKGALAISAIDLNGDQKVDIVTANRAARSVSVLTANNAGKFDRTDIAIGELLSDLATGDLTSDGRPDIVVAASENKALFMISNSSSGLGTPQAIPTGEQPGHITVADATGDGKNDLVVSLPLTHRIMILPPPPARVMGRLTYRNTPHS